MDPRERRNDNTVITPTQQDRVHSLAMDPRPRPEDNAARNRRQANVQTLLDQPSYISTIQEQLKIMANALSILTANQQSQHRVMYTPIQISPFYNRF